MILLRILNAVINILRFRSEVSGEPVKISAYRDDVVKICETNWHFVESGLEEGRHRSWTS